MKTATFISESVADAVNQIRSQLGPEAVVLSVRQTTVSGLSRLWKKPRLEILACVPDPPPPAAADDAATKAGPKLLDTRDEEPAIAETAVRPRTDGRWRCVTILESMGLLPANAERIVERIQILHGDLPPDSLGQELSFAKSVLMGHWRLSAEMPSGPVTHVFVGPAGTGKTTVLCKWMAQAVLAENRSARAWRLDTSVTNPPGLLDFYAEIFGVQVERDWKAERAPQDDEVGFVDFPGVDWQDPLAMESMKNRLRSFPDARVHLVLNAAYSIQILLAQVRAFSAIPGIDLVFTHLDEEKNPGKLWNFPVGTNFSISRLCGGQNIPGEFRQASPLQILPPPFSRQ